MSEHAATELTDQAPGLAASGCLDGLTIFRFARAYEEGGGVEGHLADLNRILSVRNRITTIQMQLTADPCGWRRPNAEIRLRGWSSSHCSCAALARVCLVHAADLRRGCSTRRTRRSPACCRRTA